MGHKLSPQLIPEAREWVYIGVRLSKAGKRLYIWFDLQDLDRKILLTKQLTPAAVGDVYQINQLKDGRQYVKGEYGPQFLRRYEHDAEIQQWVIEDESAKLELLRTTTNTKASKVKPVIPVLDTIEQMAARMNATEKRAFFSMIAERVFRMGV